LPYTYSFLSSPFLTPSRLFLGHRLETKLRISSSTSSTIYLIQDTTDFRTPASTKGAGPISTSGAPGFFLHTCLAIGEDRLPLGVTSQLIWERDWKKRDKKETAKERKERSRESEKWIKSYQETSSLLQGIEKSFIYIADREADVYEFILEISKNKNGFIIRAVRNRLLEEEDKNYSIDSLLSEKPKGVHRIEIREQGKVKREVTLSLRSTSVSVLPPRNIGRKGDPIHLNMIAAVEEKPPKGGTPIKWLILTSEPVETIEDIIKVIETYKKRWIIEEFHKGLKTGCNCEKKQFEIIESFKNFVTFASIVVYKILEMRQLSRIQPERLAEEVLPKTQIKALELLDESKKFKKKLTIKEALTLIAMLGGFQGRKGDGEPGWIVLWHGYQRVLETERILRLLEARKDSG
jgi:hypothetical protein